MDKRALVSKLVEALGRDIAVLKQAALATREAATHEEARPENDKDTRAIEAAYLAGAQADRVRELERDANALSFLELRAFQPGDPVSLSALVEVEPTAATDDAARLHYFVAPRGGGLAAEVDGVRITVVTPEAPLGRALLGKAEGDVATVRVAGGTREYEIVGIH